MTYKELLSRLKKMSVSELNANVAIYDQGNDHWCDVLGFADEMSELHPIGTDDDAIIID